MSQNLTVLERVSPFCNCGHIEKVHNLLADIVRLLEDEESDRGGAFQNLARFQDLLSEDLAITGELILQCLGALGFIEHGGSIMFPYTTGVSDQFLRAHEESKSQK